jgi:dTDP-4-dehydrorhamnose 3,5-epimerase
VKFVNEFNFSEVKRFYTVKNNANQQIRAWHGHQKEKKYFFCSKGIFVIALVKVDDFANPSKNLEIEKFILASESPQILEVPPGYANGSMNLLQDSELTVFSDSTLDQSLADDFRYPYDYWDAWQIPRN